jgi:hypothetical protein
VSNKLKTLMDNGCKWSHKGGSSTVDSMCIIVNTYDKRFSHVIEFSFLFSISIA